MNVPPKSWADCQKLLGSPDFNVALQTRLVQIAFTDSGATAVRAIDLLLNMRRPVMDDELSSASDAQLLEAAARVDAFLAQYLGGDNGNG